MEKHAENGPGGENRLLQEKIRTAPQGPGCYLFRNAIGAVIYVGKGKNIRHRVRQYFQPGRQTGEWEKLKRLIRSVRDVSFLETPTELDALLHEHRLIKEYRPWFNSQMKADRVRPYLRIGETGSYATFTITPDRADDGARYFGYFYDTDSARQALDTLQRVWNTPSCGKDALPATSGRACMQYHLGSCLAPCEGKPDRAEYARRIAEAVRFLEGSDTAVLRRMETEMNVHAASLRFEKAAACKNLLSDLERLGRTCRKRSNYSDTGDSLLFLRVYRDAGFSLFLLRCGRVAARWDFPEGLDEAGLGEFLRRISEQEEAAGQEDWLVSTLTGIYADQLFVAVPQGVDNTEIAALIKGGFERFHG